MKSPIAQLNPLFENRIRLGIMSVLIVQDSVDFNSLKGVLEVTDGNLASHMAVLEKNRLVRVRKSFVGRKPQTRYEATDAGKRAFAAHVGALERMIRSTR
jgi:DNA-binding HxlR family transcriptional regulator